MSHGTVHLRVDELYTSGRVLRISDAIEDRLRIVLLRLMIEDEDDLAFGVDIGVVVVVDPRRRDAVTRKDYGRSDVNRVFKCTEGLRGVPHRWLTITHHRDGAICTVGTVFNDVETLLVRRQAVRPDRDRVKTSLGKLAGDPLHSEIITGLHAHAALQTIRRQKGDIVMQITLR